MPSLIGNYVAQNYRQQQVPFSRFGTRKIAWYRVGRTDTNNGGAIDMVKMNEMVDAIQTQAELVTIGAPYVSDNWGKFMIAVFEDTANDGNTTNAQTASGQVGYNSNAKTLQQALRDVTSDSSIVVERMYLFGAPSQNTDDYYGFSVNPEYKEYDSKAEYFTDSYLNPGNM